MSGVLVKQKKKPLEYEPLGQQTGGYNPAPTQPGEVGYYNNVNGVKPQAKQSSGNWWKILLAIILIVAALVIGILVI